MEYGLFIIVGVLALMFILMVARQKRDAKKNQELMDSFKVGDKVVTHIGIYGKIKRIYNTTYGKVCVLEIGTLDKIDIELDMRYIAGIDEKTAVSEDVKDESKITEESQKEQIVEEIKENKKEEKQNKNTKKSKNSKKRK